MSSIRPIALCLFQHNEQILVEEIREPDGTLLGHRPIGGGIELGEHSRDTIIREVREELSAEISNPIYLYTLENIFIANGHQGHEIVQVYDARFADESLYDLPEIVGYEHEVNASFRAFWKRVSDFFEPDSLPLFPNGLLDKLRAD